MKSVSQLCSILVICQFMLISSCSEKKLPARAEIPLIKVAISRIEGAVRDRNQAALDSLMSIQMLERNLTSDSLISFVWGQIPIQRFARFSDCDIRFTNANAQCNCLITDDIGASNGGIQLQFSYEDKRWLLFQFSYSDIDSTH